MAALRAPILGGGRPGRDVTIFSAVCPCGAHIAARSDQAFTCECGRRSEIVWGNPRVVEDAVVVGAEREGSD